MISENAAFEITMIQFQPKGFLPLIKTVRKLGLGWALTSVGIMALGAGATCLNPQQPKPLSCLLHEYKRARGLESLIWRHRPGFAEPRESRCWRSGGTVWLARSRATRSRFPDLFVGRVTPTPASQPTRLPRKSCTGNRALGNPMNKCSGSCH